MKTIPLSAYLLFVGNPGCRYMHSDKLDAVQLVAQSIYHDIPGRTNRQLIIGDCCPAAGNCPGHPGSSHGKLKSLDICYYTLSGSITQWHSGAEKDAEIWTKEWILDDAVFDAKRNFLFFERLTQIMPGTTIWVNSVIGTKIRDVRKPTAKYSESDGRTYNHHLHAHIDLGTPIQNFKVKDFVQLR